MVKDRLILLALLPLLACGCVVALIRFGWAALVNPGRAWMLAVAVDDLVNVAGNGTLWQTVSRRAARAMQDGKPWGCCLCRLLDAVDPGHCARALSSPIQGLHP